MLVFITMIPQMLALEGGRKTDEVIRASYLVVKERYRDAVMLLIVPELVARTLFIGLLYAVNLFTGVYSVFVIFLFSMALLEGGRTAYVAAAFNRFYYHVLEEEKKKKVKAGKKTAAKQSAGKGPAAKQPAARRPAGKQGRTR